MLNRAAAVLCVVATLAAGDALKAQDQTVFGNGTRVTGFGGAMAKFGNVAGRGVVMAGATGAVVLNRQFAIGIGGYGADAMNVHPPVGALTPDAHLSFGYGGAELEYIVSPSRVAHVTLKTFLGVGGASWNTGAGPRYQDDETDKFLVAEPSANVDVNLLRFARLQVGVGYRFANGVDLTGLRDRDLSGAVGTLGIKLGHF
jgi:hypothetical protein